MKKGISMLALSIGVIIIVVLVSTVVISSKPVIENLNKNKFIAEILLIEESISEYFITNSNYPEEGKILIDIKNIASNDLVQFEKEKTTDDKIELYLIDYEKIGIENKQFGNNKDGQNKDIYTFSKTTGKVYYLKGISYEGRIFYTLTEDLADIEPIYKANKKEIKIQDCIFMRKDIWDGFVDIDEYANNNIYVVVYIPLEATNISITYKNHSGNSLYKASKPSDKPGYYKYETTASGSIFTYDIIVNYTLNGKEKVAEFSENKQDKEGPKIDLTNMYIQNLTHNGETNTYLTGFTISDNLNGVKIKKYEYGDIELLYFNEKRGKDIIENKIDITGIDYLTLYAEDGIGNKTLTTIDIQEQMSTD